MTILRRLSPETSTALSWDLYYFKLTQPLTVSSSVTVHCKGERGKTWLKKNCPFHMVWEIHTETSSLRTLKIMPRNEILRSWIRLLLMLRWLHNRTVSQEVYCRTQLFKNPQPEEGPLLYVYYNFLCTNNGLKKQRNDRRLHRKKSFSIFPVPIREVTYQTLPGREYWRHI